MNALKTTVLSSVACATSVVLAAVPYANDFARRTSGPIQTGRWMVCRYVTGQFAANYSVQSGQPGEQLAYDATAEIQDNWAKITQAGTVANMIPSIADNSANEAAGEPGANPYARFGCSVSTGRRRPVDSSSHKLAKTNERAF